jgi:hypothetical protein
MSLLDDLREDIAREGLSSLSKSKTRIGSKEKDAASLSEVRRFTSWSDENSFVDGGYLAKVVGQRCKSCGQRNEHVLGIFHVEIKPDGCRRLQRLDPRAQLPAQTTGRAMEYEESDVPACANCLMGENWGFDQVVETPAVRSLTFS